MSHGMRNHAFLTMVILVFLSLVPCMANAQCKGCTDDNCNCQHPFGKGCDQSHCSGKESVTCPLGYCNQSGLTNVNSTISCDAGRCNQSGSSAGKEVTCVAGQCNMEGAEAPNIACTTGLCNMLNVKASDQARCDTGTCCTDPSVAVSSESWVDCWEGGCGPTACPAEVRADTVAPAANAGKHQSTGNNSTETGNGESPSAKSDDERSTTNGTNGQPMIAGNETVAPDDSSSTAFHFYQMSTFIIAAYICLSWV